MPDPDDAPDTVTEAVALLRSLGYTDELRLGTEGVECDGRVECHPASSAVVEHQFRFEGPSDPADMAVVLGVHLPEWGLKGVLVSAYGPYMPAEKAAVWLELTTAERRPRS